ncbi:MAG: LLM class flavin-dependent oxidoreductase [Pseudomonadota bacterium]
MIAFLQAANCSNYPGSWRHAHTHSDFLSADYFQRIARTLEAGKFHLAFFDDRLAMPDRYGDDVEATLEHGIRAVKFDLIPIMTAMGLATERLGIGGTYSTTYYEPFHVARVFASLDHMIKGRAAWNVVTSLNDSEAANFGFDSHPEHDKRYDRADEFMRAVLGHWDSWDADALVLDRASGRFADASKVRRLNHVGEFFKTRGPFTVPRSPQGRPVVIQAGQSGRGRQFAARWGELVFAIMHSEEFGRTIRQQLRDEVASIGRNPDEVRIAPAVYTIVGETQTMAEEKAAYVEGLAEGIDTLVLLSEALNFDFATKGLNDPFTDDELNNISGLQAIRDRVVGVSGKPNPTSQDFIDYSGRGTVHEVPCFVGSPSQVADQMESWFVGGACDGFVLAATHIPGGYEDFVRLVVPELQRRGLYHNDYRGGSLRETLGLAHPDPYDWKFD